MHYTAISEHSNRRTAAIGDAVSWHGKPYKIVRFRTTLPCGVGGRYLMGKLPRGLSGRQVRTALERTGFVFRHQRGSHMSMRRGEPYTRVVLPDHRLLRLGTLRKILHEAGLTVEDCKHSGIPWGFLGASGAELAGEGSGEGVEPDLFAGELRGVVAVELASPLDPPQVASRPSSGT